MRFLLLREICGDYGREADEKFRFFAAWLAALFNVASCVRRISPNLRKRSVERLGEQTGIALQHFAQRCLGLA